MTVFTVPSPSVPTPGRAYDRENETQYRRETERWQDEVAALLSAHSLDLSRTGGIPFVPAVGRWYRNSVTAAAGASLFSVTANRVYYTPFVFTRDVSLDGIAFEVRAQGAAGAEGRLAVYTNDYEVGLAPRALIVQSDDIDCTTTGVKEALFVDPKFLDGGRIFWMAGVWDDGSISVSGYDVDNTYTLGAVSATAALQDGGSTHAFEDIGAWTEMPAQAGTVSWGAEGVDLAPSFVLRISL